MSKDKFFGYVLTAIGLLFISFPHSLTGAVIGATIFNGIKIIFGLVFIVGGIALIVSGLEDITIYSKKNGKNREAHLIDPKLTLGNLDMTLDEFRNGVEEIIDDSELMDIVRETYVPQLEEMKNSSKKELADKFLEVLERVKKDEYKLPKDEKREIRDTFTQLRGNLTPQQKGVFHRYGISMEVGAKHNKLRLGDGILTLSKGTHENPRTGQNFSHELTKFIEKYYKNS